MFYRIHACFSQTVNFKRCLEKETYWYDFNHLSKGFWNFRSQKTLDKMKYIDLSVQAIKWSHYYLTNRAFLSHESMHCFRSRCQKLWSFSRNSVEMFIVFFMINYISEAMSSTHTHLYVEKESINIKTLLKSKTFWIKTLRMWPTGLLIVSYQTIFVKTKLDVLFREKM